MGNLNTNQITGPTLILDEDIVKRNIAHMCLKAHNNQINFRPHFKTHQSKAIGQLFKDHGVASITVSSIPMAAYFAEDGWEDICIAIPINIREKNRLIALSRIPRLHLVVESLDSLVALSDFEWVNPPSIFIKIDAGYERTGIKVENYPAIQKQINEIESSSFGFSGLLVHMGNTYDARSKAEVRSIWREATERINILRQNLTNGEDCYISMGDTPSCSVLDKFPGFNEIRPGNFVFYDLTQEAIGSCSFDQIAVCLACPILAIHEDRNMILVHAGGIHLSKDSLETESGKIFGIPVLFKANGWELIKGAAVVKLSQEHGTIKAPKDLVQDLKIGSLLGIIPVHSCMTANLMASYMTKDGNLLDHMNALPSMKRF